MYERVCCFALFFVAAAIAFNGYYQKWHFLEAGVPGSYQAASFERMVDGTANRPFIYRQLLPAIANAIDRATPTAAKSWSFAHQGAGPGAYLLTISSSPTVNNPKYFFRYLVVYCVTFLFTLLAVYGMYWLCLAVGFAKPVATMSAVILILLYPFCMSVGGYFYDFPELAFFALACLVALRFDWWWLIPIAALGEWNKESFVLVVLTLYPLLRIRRSRLASLAAVAVLGLVCVSVYGLLRLKFGHNPGGTVEVRWLEQLRWFEHPKYLLYESEETYGMRLLRPMTVLPMGLLLWTIARAWRGLPPGIQQHAMIAAAINLPLYFLFCAPGELRDLSMLSILVLLAIATNVNRWIATAPATERLRTDLSGQ
jgi:hypothetical protein